MVVYESILSCFFMLYCLSIKIEKKVSMIPKNMSAADRLSIDKRWQKAVDFGSPMSAWSLEMLVEKRNAEKEGRRPEMEKVREMQRLKKQ